MSRLAHLRTFLEVYRQQSISKASTKLNITQPAVTQHTQALEMLVGKNCLSAKLVACSQPKWRTNSPIRAVNSGSVASLVWRKHTRLSPNLQYVKNRVVESLGNTV